MAGAKSLKFLQNQMRALNRYDFISSMDKLDSVYSDKSKGQKPLLQAFLQRMVQCRWESWATFEGRTARVALFGAGVHTYWFLSVVRNSKGPHVVAILDDFARIGAKVFGIPVIRAAGFDPSQVDAIIPCTDSNQAKFTQRCKELYGNRIPVWKLYEGLPAGPYQKEFTNAPRRHK